MEMEGVTPVGVFDPEVEDPDFQIDPNEPNAFESSIVPLHKKAEAVKYWKGKLNGKLRSLEQVQNKFRFVSHVSYSILIREGNHSSVKVRHVRFAQDKVSSRFLPFNFVTRMGWAL